MVLMFQWFSLLHTSAIFRHLFLSLSLLWYSIRTFFVFSVDHILLTQSTKHYEHYNSFCRRESEISIFERVRWMNEKRLRGVDLWITSLRIDSTILVSSTVDLIQCFSFMKKTLLFFSKFKFKTYVSKMGDRSQRLDGFETSIL